MWALPALYGFIISIIFMFLVARKWNLRFRAVLFGAPPFALLVAIPFLWIYHLPIHGWLLLLCVIGQAGLAFVIALSVVVYRFWRDPEREPPREDRVIVSAADGEIIYITTIPDAVIPLVTKNGRDYSLEELAGCRLDQAGMTVIGIDMNLMNVHVNRCPIGGEVKLIKHIDGKFMSLKKREAPFINARCTTVIENESLTVATVQIASRLVRRVDNFLDVGQSIHLGDRLGMIRFGSQVAVIFPDRKDIRIDVSIGQVVLAGTSILAHYLK